MLLDMLAPYIGMVMLVAFLVFAWHMREDDEPPSSKKARKNKESSQR